MTVLRERPAHTPAVLSQCTSELTTRMAAARIPITRETLTGTFAIAASHRMAPYGRSVAFEWRDLVTAPVLDCDNYVALAYFLYRHAGGRGGLRFIGWDRPPIGNHAQLWLGDVMLDPTYGVVAHAPLGDVLRGAPTSSILDLSFADPFPGGRSRLVDVFRVGRITRGNWMFAFASFAAFVSFERSFTAASRPGATGG